MNSTVIVLLVLGGAVVLIGAWYAMQRWRSRTLRERFGPEYSATVRRHGRRAPAESELEPRVKRVERFHIRPLPERDRQQYLELWRRNQEQFVDSPEAAIHEADILVCDVMKDRGYPMSNFEARAEDLSVDHPHVVHNYRAAHEIVERYSYGTVNTEGLRRAFVCYRDLFAELLEPPMIREDIDK